MMVLEWIRRNDAKFDEFAREYLFKTADITEIESRRPRRAEAGRRPRAASAAACSASAA